MNTEAKLTPVRKAHRFDEAALTQYLTTELDGFCEPFSILQFEGGQSNPTYLLSDGTREPLDVASLGVSPRDGALLCRVKRDAAPPGLLARFTHAAHADLLAAVEVGAGRPALRLGGALRPLPEAVAGN